MLARQVGTAANLPLFSLVLLLLGGGCFVSASAGRQPADDPPRLSPQLLARALAIGAGEVARDPELAARKLRTAIVELRNQRGGATFEQELSPECGVVFSSLLSNILGLVGGNELPESMQFLRWLDSIFKPEAGILLGNVKWIGSREECEGLRLPVYQDTSNISSLLFHTNGRYCMFGVQSRGNTTSGDGTFSGGDIGAYLQSSLELALCLPNPCQGLDAEIAVNFVFEIVLNLLGPILQGVPGIGGIVDTIKSYKLIVRGCAQTHVEAGSSLSSGAIAMITLTVILLVLILTATIVTGYADYRHPGGKNMYRDICRAFCLRSNLNKLFAPSSGDTMSCINGIRVLSIFWVILGHTLLFVALLLDNPLQLLDDFRKRWQAVIILNATTSVDSFFMISGALVAFVFCRHVSIDDREKCRRTLSSAKFWLVYYFHRYWRLTPTLVFFMFWHWSLSGYFGNGPFVPTNRVPSDMSGCPKAWWTLPLYVQNFVRVGDANGCLGHTWYLANDMQMYLASPILLLPFVFGGLKIGSVVSVAVVTISMICTGVLNSEYGFRRGHLNFEPGNPDGYYPETTSYYELIYIKPYCRMGAYAIGILLGYVLATRKTVRLHKLVVLLCWMVAVAGGLALLYLVQGQIANTGQQLTLPQVTAYWSFLRPGFALCVAWVVFACVYGYGGPVNELLSWSWFTPLARLSYCAYIVHAAVMITFFTTYDSKFHLSDSMLILIYLASIMATFLVSLVLSMLIEAPLLGLERAIRGGGAAARIAAEPKAEPSHHHDEEEPTAAAEGKNSVPTPPPYRSPEGRTNSAYDSASGRVSGSASGLQNFEMAIKTE